MPYPGYIITTGGTGGGGLSNACNGLTDDGVSVCLGGLLCANTTIDGNSGAYDLSIINLDSFNLGFDNVSTITDGGTNGGLRYAGDYSANYINRSIPDVSYVTGLTSTIQSNIIQICSDIDYISAATVANTADIMNLAVWSGQTNNYLTYLSGQTSANTADIMNLAVWSGQTQTSIDNLESWSGTSTPVINSAITGATNGIGTTGRKVCLGGALVANTNIIGNYTLSFCDNAKINSTSGYQVSGVTVFDTGNASNAALQIGYAAQAFGNCGIAIGYCAKSYCNPAIAIGGNSVASGASTIAIVGSATCGNSITLAGIATCGGIAIGAGSRATGFNTVSIGGVTCSGNAYGIALGYYACAISTEGISIGHVALTNANETIAIGCVACSTQQFSVALGAGAQATGTGTVSIGKLSCATQTCSFAIGYNSHATGIATITIGECAQTNGSCSIAIGRCATALNANYSLAIGNTTCACGAFNIIIGSGGCAWCSDSIVIGESSCSLCFSSIAIGRLNKSLACETVTIGHVNHACALRSYVLGGCNNKICSGNTLTTLVGGHSLTLDGTGFSEYVVVPNLSIYCTPTTGACTDSVLVWNSTDKKVKRVPYLSGSTSGFALCCSLSIIGNSSATGFTLTHNLNKQFVNVQIVESASPYATIYTDVQRPNANCIYVSFDTAPLSGINYCAIIIG